MFEHYDENARRTIWFARYEADRLGSPEIVPEHILLGLVDSDPSLASDVIVGFSAQGIRDEILCNLPRHEREKRPVTMSFSRESQHLLTAARDEADRLANLYVNNHHMLLGMLSMEDCFAAQVLRRRGLSPHQLRSQLSTLRTSTEELAPQTASAADDLSGSNCKLSALEGHVIELFRKKDYYVALKLVDEAIADPSFDTNQIKKGLVQIASVIARIIGSLDLARRYCELRLACDPEDAMALYELADCLALQGKTDEAHKIASRSYNLTAGQSTPQSLGLAELIEHRFPELKPEA